MADGTFTTKRVALLQQVPSAQTATPVIIAAPVLARLPLPSRQANAQKNEHWIDIRNLPSSHPTTLYEKRPNARVNA